MTSALSNEKFVAKIEKSPGFIADFQACNINAIRYFLNTSSPKHKITVEDLKKVFDYDQDGSDIAGYNFNKLNVLLRKHGIPYKVSKSYFNCHKDLVKHINLPVPVFFHMTVMRFIKASIEKSGKKLIANEDELFKDTNFHLLLLVDFGDSGDTLYFIDPVHQLPYFSKKDFSNRDKLCKLNIKQFHESVRRIKAFIQFKHIPQLEKIYKKTKKPRYNRKN